MGIKSNKWIREKSLNENMIAPFAEEQVGRDVVSYGVSSYGYDIRVGDEFKIFTNIGGTVVDPKNFDEKNVVDFKGGVCIVLPNSFALSVNAILLILHKLNCSIATFKLKVCSSTTYFF